jgi:hypothetical protein
MFNPNHPYDGGPAFSRAAGVEGGDYCNGHPGMSLRDYFAAAIIQGRVQGGWIPGDEAKCVAECYQLADAMLAARQSKPKE